MCCSSVRSVPVIMSRERVMVVRKLKSCLLFKCSKNICRSKGRRLPENKCIMTRCVVVSGRGSEMSAGPLMWRMLFSLIVSM